MRSVTTRTFVRRSSWITSYNGCMSAGRHSIGVRGGETALRRSLLLKMALRRTRPGSGTSPALLRERTAMSSWPNLTPILAGLPWAVVGAVATRAYMPERMTRDLDILVPTDKSAEVRARLQAAAFAEIQELAIGGATWRSPAGEEVDVIELREEWVLEALRHLERDPQGLPVLALPYLVLMKVRAGRVQDLADAARMLGLAADELRQATRQVFERHMPDALEDLESLITLGRLEVEAEDDE